MLSGNKNKDKEVPVRNYKMKDNIFRAIAGGLSLLLFIFSATAAPIVRQGSGANTAALQTIVDLFRTDLGGANNGVGGCFTSGRREINWDGVPDDSAPTNCSVSTLSGR